LATEDLRFATAQELIEFAASEQLGSYAELNTVPSSMELLEKTKEGIGLSELGYTFNKLRDDVRADVLHFLMYSGWNEAEPRNFLPSWTYRYLCNEHWEKAEIDLTSDFLDRQVEATINHARQTFEGIDVGPFDEISFSLKSLQGFYNWLGALEPAVIEEDTFTRRAFCSPELLLLAIGYVMKDVDGATDTDILLSREKRDAICRLCLLEPEALDRALDWMIPIYPNVIKPGTSAGYYGRFVRLVKIPTLADVVR